MIREYLLRKLPVYQGSEIKVIEEQRVPDIIREILKAHYDYARDYDTIADLYMGYDVPEVCRALFRLCKNEFRYEVEDENRQTVRSPGAIVALAKVTGADCKHYASFIGGALDALKRRGKKITWCYRFASYDYFDQVPEHVFIAVDHDGQELWVDPVLESFNQRYPDYFYNEDHYTDMSLYRVSGIGRQPMYNTTVSLVKDTAATRPVYGCTVGTTETDSTSGSFDFTSLLLQAANKLTEFFGKLFGGGWQFTTGVRWLTAYYQYYVLGMADATSSNKVDERYTPDAQAWFAVVLGVPVYDRYRLHALMGTNPADGVSLNKTDQQRAQEYLALGPDTASVDPAAVEQAVQIAKKFKWGQAPGSWQQFGIAAPDVTGSGTGSGSGSGSGSGTNNGSGTNGVGIMDWIKANPFESALIGAAAYFGVIRPIITKKRKS